MAPITQASDESSHQALLEKLDIHSVRRPFRNPSWKPPQRRNKNVKQIISEASRREASVMATQNNSGSSTPIPSNLATGVATPTNPAGATNLQPSIAQAAQSLSTLVLDRNARLSAVSSGGAGGGGGPVATYTNIESAPSLHPSSRRHYCDITGLPAPYTDPKTRLRYHDREVFAVVRSLGQGMSEAYLAVRGAHTVLK